MTLSLASKWLQNLMLLLLLTRPPGVTLYVIEVPTNYMALQGELVVRIIFPQQTTDSTWEQTEYDSTQSSKDAKFESNSIKYSTVMQPNLKHNGGLIVEEDANSNKRHDENDSTFTEPSTTSLESSEDDSNDIANLKTETSPQKKYKKSFQARDAAKNESMHLSLHSVNSKKLLKKVPVSIDGTQTVFSFSCGVIVHGGFHFARLKMNKIIIAESSFFNVSWPPLIIKIPVVLETYRSPADIEFSFTTAHLCLFTKPKAFETWVELLYHGTETESQLSAKLSSSSVLRQTAKVSSDRNRISSSQPNRRSMEGSIILTKSNSNIKSEVLKKFDWDGSSQVQVVQRVRLVNQLYSKGKHKVRFGCEIIGPAGKYSVRIVTNVVTNPVIAESDTFLVEWDEAFKLEVPRDHLFPCSYPVPVTYSSEPLCVGKEDKIRLYAHVKANVTSTNPPIYLRYITERRAINQNTSFDCNLFTDELAKYCFVYVNTASWGAVSYVRTQCVPTFKAGVLRTDGQWGKWSPWSQCTTTCGSGMQIRHRFCDNPQPRNGGEFCRGLSLTMKPCGHDSCVPLQLETTTSTDLPPIDGDDCRCGCFVNLTKDATFTIAPSALMCPGTSYWFIKGPPGTIVVAELIHSILLGGSQWLKVRDGNNLSSALLLSLPSSSITLRDDGIPLRISSTNQYLLIDFRSDVNISMIVGAGNAMWGFTMRLEVQTNEPHRLEWSPHAKSTSFKANAFHITIIAMGINVLVAISCYLAYYCKRYPAYKKSLLIVDDSPLETPTGSPMHQRATILVSSTASIATLTEVLSLKSFKFGMRRKSTASSYTRLARDGDSKSRMMITSLPSSPMLSTTTRFPNVLQSSSQILRRLKNKNTNRKIQNRRSASFNQLRMDVSPIYEDLPTMPNSITMECLTNKRRDSLDDDETSSKKGEEHGDKYREYRKSLLASKKVCEAMNLDTTKLSKDRVNQKLHLLKSRRDANSNSSSGDAGMRTSSSLSELSMASGVDQEMEYDYYDYDVGNASAVPGSIFGIDPSAVSPPWIIDIDDLDIKTPEQLTAVAPTTPRSTLISSPEPVTGEEIPMRRLNIPHDTLQESTISNESNESDDITPRFTEPPMTEEIDDERTPRNVNEPNEAIKILNIHDVEDFQFADDSEDDV